MTKSSRLTYDDLKRFFDVALSELLDLSSVPPEDLPMTALSRLEAQSRAQATTGLKMAIKDLMVPLAMAPVAKLDRLSVRLAEAGAPSVALIRAWASRGAGKVLDRGYIRSDEEFYQLNGLLDGADLEEHERERIQAIVDAYEFGG